MTTSTEPRENLIEIKNVSFGYGQHPALEDVSFSVQTGDYIGIIGPNGGGKTTLLNVILGLIKPDSGEVLVFGRRIDQIKHERARVGYVPQRLSQLDANFPGTVYEIVCSGRTALNGLFHAFSAIDRQAVEAAMEVAKIGQFRNQLINDLSGGERQRVMIARALSGDPKILILDEPTTGVDLTSQEQFYAFLNELNRHHGLTIMLVSHDIDVVANEVHKLLLLNRKVIAFRPAKEITSKGYLEKLYGDKVDFVFHHHHHDHH